MAGRPLGIRSLVRELGRLTAVQVKRLISRIGSAPKSDDLQRLERERDRHMKALQKVERQIAELSGGNGSAAAQTRRGRKPGRRKGYKLSAATRAKMRAAALRRYAKVKPDEANREPKGRKYRMSPEGRKRIADAARRRWAAARAAKEGQKMVEKA